MCREGFRQDVGRILKDEVVEGHVGLPEDIVLIVEHEVFLGDAVGVILVDEHAHCRHNHLHAYRGIEQEGFVADEADVGGIQAEAFYELLRHSVRADKDGYLAEVEAVGKEVVDLFRHVGDGVLHVVVGLLEQSDSDVALLVCLLCHLPDFLIDVAQLDSLLQTSL